jgi:adenosylcobinamide-GDP ribazoletransferase
MTVLRAFLCAVSFLTRIPAPGRDSLTPRVAGLSVAFFPVVGLLLGAVLAGAGALLLDRFPPHLAWALALVSLHVFFTGALHLDGLSDVADGLGGSSGNRERALEIMRDVRVGAFGVVALILVLIGKVVLMNEVLRRGDAVTLLLVCPVAARLAAVPLIVFFPCARPEGLARTFHEESGWPAALVAAVFAAGAIAWAGESAYLPSAAAVAVALAVGSWIAVRLGGLTGDAYGAAIELAEVGFLLAAAWPRLRGA